MDNIIINTDIQHNKKLYYFWKIYDYYGITTAIEWLEKNKYYDDITDIEIDNINKIIDNIRI